MVAVYLYVLVFHIGWVMDRWFAHVEIGQSSLRELAFGIELSSSGISLQCVHLFWSSVNIIRMESSCFG